jgi:hypothetical protein
MSNRFLLFLDGTDYPSNDPIKLKISNTKVCYDRNNNRDTRYTNEICWESVNIFSLDSNKRALDEAGFRGILFVKFPVN